MQKQHKPKANHKIDKKELLFLNYSEKMRRNTGKKKH